MAATSSTSSHSSRRARRASLGAFGAGGLTAWVWLAVASTTAIAPVQAQYSPPPSPPPPPPSPPPPSPPPPSPPPASPPPATGFTPTVRLLGTHTGLASVGEVNTTNCCQWYKWCDNTNVTVQCTSALITDCDAVGPGSWNASCAACGMCRDSQGGPAGMRKKAYLAIDHPYQACIDTRRTVQTQSQIADPTITNHSVAQNTQIARDYTNADAPDFVVCSTLNYKCLKQRSSAGCQVIPGVKIPGVKHSSTFGRSVDASAKDPRRGPADGRLNLGAGMMVYDANRNADKVADMHDRGDSTHTGFEYPHGITKFDGDGLHASYDAQTQYANTSDPIGR